MAAHLEDVSAEELIKEVQRRIDCQTKPEKHLILIGAVSNMCICCCLLRLQPIRHGEKAMLFSFILFRPTWLWEGHAVAEDQKGALPVPPRHRRHAASSCGRTDAPWARGVSMIVVMAASVLSSPSHCSTAGF